ncbi:caspase family protein [Clostridium botulinum]|uniref:caspase family protein n=1 Tax=unclassified Clostridium TaxID=2614128 RepID=UPI0013C8DDE1|nr:MULTISPECIES: caspase family protein [unclassified Clostridium]MBY7008159.1 caspase family protein [Clostridium botulinum]NFH73559.1 caspase family protein [Clostridium botulinum]NFI01918.1 caspase family protein [Clostridium botulinum]NFI64024.1 caspase family protein [Clostridium botulinum]NFI82048.1 caspase family protein [Clostridium botulinum]
MSVLRALVIGVSNYKAMNEHDLPFCKNDISAVCDALVCGLKVEKTNIYTCGNNETVKGSDFIAALQNLISITDAEDTLIFYFSGHGGTLPTGHHLLLSDCFVNTKDIIVLLESIPAKNKIIFLDSCMSGNFNINQTASFNINDTVEDFVGKGYAVFASSSATQVSYGHPDKSISLFTSFLCEALRDVHIIKKGKKSLYDISKLLFLYLDIWNKKNPKKQQNPIFRANLGGTIFFEIQEYYPFYTAKIHEETDDYIIYAVEPLHNGLSKIYAVKVILKSPFSFEDISEITHEIINKVKKADVYQNEISQSHWQGKDTNFMFCYYGRDESDIMNNNYLCHTTWVDESQDKEWWYKLDKNSAIINDIHFNFHSYYENLKIFTEENIGDKDMLIEKNKCIMSHLITLAEKVIGLYNEFLNGTKSEETLVEDIEVLIPSIEKYYFEETDLAIPPIELKAWSQCCSNLSGTVHDFTLFYNTKYLSGRTYQNRIACMNMTINRYYEDLEALKKTKA